MRDEPNNKLKLLMYANEIPQKVLIAIDSRTVAMEVGIRQGVCNNSPAEAISPENGSSLSVQLILVCCVEYVNDLPTCREA